MAMKTQVAIVGGGPAGTASAIFLADAGIESLIIEKEPFPRFHIGESMTGWAAERLRKLGLEEQMVAHGFPIKYAGSVYGSNGAGKFDVPVSARVSGQERRTVPTWQVKRSVFDKLLLDTAIERGAGHMLGSVGKPDLDGDGKIEALNIQLPDGTQERVEADVVIDASGRSTWLSSSGLTGPKLKGNYAGQVALYSHVKGAIRNPGEEEGNTLLFFKETDYWSWFIPVDPETVSIGIVVPSEYFRTRREKKDVFFKRELLELNPNLTERVGGVDIGEVTATANFSYSVQDFTGPNYLCVGDAHRFIDPFFSFGIHLAMSEAEKATETIGSYLASDRTDPKPFSGYQTVCDRGMDVLEDLIDSFWVNPLGWGYMLHYTPLGSDMLDILGGMIYEDTVSEGLATMRRMKAKSSDLVAANA